MSWKKLLREAGQAAAAPVVAAEPAAFAAHAGPSGAVSSAVAVVACWCWCWLVTYRVAVICALLLVSFSTSRSRRVLWRLTLRSGR